MQSLLYNMMLNEKALFRETECRVLGCNKAPQVWVREVGFGSDITDIVVSSADYQGPVPGFCIGHLATGPADLARDVYYSRPEMMWGLTPENWFVSFTDGSMHRGLCEAIKLRIESHVVDEFSDRNRVEEPDTLES